MFFNMSKFKFKDKSQTEDVFCYESSELRSGYFGNEESGIYYYTLSEDDGNGQQRQTQKLSSYFKLVDIEVQKNSPDFYIFEGKIKTLNRQKEVVNETKQIKLARREIGTIAGWDLLRHIADIPSNPQKLDLLTEYVFEITIPAFIRSKEFISEDEYKYIHINDSINDFSPDDEDYDNNYGDEYI